MVDANERLRGLLGVARDLLASVVERGLHLPEAAAVIRGPQDDETWIPPKPPFATVTLAEIYAAQGHGGRALAIIEQILMSDPTHTVARELREKLLAAAEPPPDDSEKMEQPEAPSETEDETPAIEPPPTPTSSSVPLEVAPPSPPKLEQPVPMLDDEPLPPRYDVDEVVALPVDPRTLYVYWEVRDETLAEARAELEDGKLAIRVVSVTATWEGPLVETRDIEVQAKVGDWFVRELPPGAIPRVALGWLSSRGFLPLAIALDIGAPPEAPSPLAATTLARFTEEGFAEPIEASEGTWPSAYARAVERYRRKLARSVMASVEAGQVVGEGGTLTPEEAVATGEKLPLVSPSSPTSGGWASE